MDSDYKNWNVLNCLNHLKNHIQFTSDSKQEILDALKRAFKKVNESSIVSNSRMKNKAKKLYDNACETFKRREITEFFEKLDQEFDARQNEWELERSFDRNGCELLKKSSDFNTLKLSSRYAEKSTELIEKERKSDEDIFQPTVSDTNLHPIQSTTEYADFFKDEAEKEEVIENEKALISKRPYENEEAVASKKNKNATSQYVRDVSSSHDDNNFFHLSPEETQAHFSKIHEQKANYNIQYVSVNTMAFPALKEYCNILERLEDHCVEEESQRGRHLFKLLSWSVVDSKLFPTQDPICYPDLWRPAVNFGIVIAGLEDTRHQKLQDAIPALNRIIKEGKMGMVQSGIVGTIQRWLGLEPADFVIDAPTALSALTSILLFTPLPVRPGADPSENHFKSQLWTKILSDAFSLNIVPFEPTWELHHQIPGDSGKGSARSDFACVATSLTTKEQYPFFILEFEVGGMQVHKDYAVVVAEASHALNRILSTHTYSESEISLIRVHVALVNNAHIRFGMLRPLYSQEYDTILYLYDQDIKSFDLQSDCIGINIENTFNLIVYLRQVVCKDGLYLRNLLDKGISGKKRKLCSEFPRLPSEAEKSRLPKVNFTPKTKRVRYKAYSTLDEGDDSRDSSAYYGGDLLNLLKESNINQQVIGKIDSSITDSSLMKISNLLN
ncbi:11477_t:CDS:2 [Funneliformis mosseae]|uniref:11477_t:CDS:1 n=1 Tax=Funneliformis mosseae TaxID=27381 RepID=A0A9N9HS05_FUNMO|nr:11477_t:CDS:2 [Funneliformis mosseae]